MDIIRIVDLEVFAHHGVFAEETALGQKFLVSAALFVNASRACASDALEDAVDYGAVCQLIDATMRARTCKLIERAAQVVAEEVLAAFPSVCGLVLEVKKPWAPIGLPLAYASVELERWREGCAPKR